jgi:hypothetical protein
MELAARTIVFGASTPWIQRRVFGLQIQGKSLSIEPKGTIFSEAGIIVPNKTQTGAAQTH